MSLEYEAIINEGLQMTSKNLGCNLLLPIAIGIVVSADEKFIIKIIFAI